jgi:hypothetical protein
MGLPERELDTVLKVIAPLGNTPCVVTLPHRERTLSPTWDKIRPFGLKLKRSLAAIHADTLFMQHLTFFGLLLIFSLLLAFGKRILCRWTILAVFHCKCGIIETGIKREHPISS